MYYVYSDSGGKSCAKIIQTPSLRTLFISKNKKKQRKIREAALHLLWRGTFHYDEPRDYVGVIRTLNSKYQKFMTYRLVYNILKLCNFKFKLIQLAAWPIH